MEALSHLISNPLEAVINTITGEPATAVAPTELQGNATFTEDVLRMLIYNLYQGDSRCSRRCQTGAVLPVSKSARCAPHVESQHMALKIDLHNALQGSASVRCSRSIANLNSSHSRTFQRRCQTFVPGPDSAALLIYAPNHKRLIPCAASRDSRLIVNDTATPPSSSTGRSKAQTHAGKSAVRSTTARGRFGNRNTWVERKPAQDLESITRPPESVAWYEQPTATPTTARAATAPAAAAVSPPKQVTSSSSAFPTQLEGHIPQQHQQQSISSSQASDVSSSSSSSSSRGNKLTAELSTSQVQQLQQYLSHMLETNKSMNLTAIRDPDEAWQRHIEDSLALLPIIDKYSSSSSSSSSSSPAAAAATPVVDQQRISTGRRNRRSTIAAAAATAGHADAEVPVQQEPNMQQQQQQQLSMIDVGTGAGLPGMVFAIARPHWKVTLLDSRRKRCEFLQATADMLGLNNVTVVWSRAEDGARRADLREAHDLAAHKSSNTPSRFPRSPGQPGRKPL